MTYKQSLKQAQAHYFRRLSLERNDQRLKTETWYQDPQDADLWHGEHGLMVNSSALLERETYYKIIRLNLSEKSFNFDQLDLFA
ncbi:MAG: hypothetical protein KC422_10340 [Trueperaceae bacterium]|nr:hypothetical protein [Trueperaceae bacterium]